MKSKIPTKKVGNFSLPVLGLGTWQMGGRHEHDPANDDQRDIRGIKEAIRLGLKHLDTAERYAGGHAEELVGKAIQDVARNDLFLTSKVSWEHLSYDDVIRAFEGSRQRLGIEILDLYLIHGPNRTAPLKDTMRAMEYLFEKGRIKNIGVSNFDVPLLEEARSVCKYPIVCNQIHYNLEARAHEENGTIDYCRRHDILVTAYRPLARGTFSPAGQQILAKLSAKYQKSPFVVALNWVLNKPGVAALVKSSNPKHLQENLGALGWRLDEADEQALDQDFPRGETIGVGCHP